MLSWDVNKLICGLKYILVIVLKSFLFNIYFVLFWIILFFLFVIILLIFGKCIVVNYILFFCIKVYIFLVL